MADLWRDFWLRETGTGQQVARLHDRYMMMMMMMMNTFNYIKALHKALKMYWQLDKAPVCGLVLQLKEATNPPNMHKDSPQI